MDPLRADDLARARDTPPAQKLREALELMRTGYALKRAALRERLPNASDAEIEALFRQWLSRDD